MREFLVVFFIERDVFMNDKTQETFNMTMENKSDCTCLLFYSLMNSAGGNFEELDKSHLSLYVINLQLFILQPVEFSDMEFSESDVLPFVAAIVRQVEALQREVCVRNTYWQQQRQREEDILSDLDSALFQCLFRATEANSYQVSSGVEFAVLIVNILYGLAWKFKGIEPFEHVEMSKAMYGANSIGK